MFVAVLVVAASGALAAQWLGQSTAGIPRTADGQPNLAAPPPRAPDGKPDLSGLWAKTSPKYARNIAADLKPDEISPWARETVERRREDLGKDGMQVRCLPLGPAYATSGDSTGSEMMRIVQTPQLIVMLNPDLTYRQIWMDGRALEPSPNPSWMGYSVGRWEGETLVVESYGFHAGTWLDRDGHPHTEQAAPDRAVSPPELRDAGDRGHVRRPGAYTRPWTVKVVSEYAADTEMLEWVCNEGASRSLVHWVGKASDERQERGEGARRRCWRATSAPTTSSRRSGEACRSPGAAQATGRTVQITVEDGRLVGEHGWTRQAGADRDRPTPSSAGSTASACSSSTAASS